MNAEEGIGHVAKWLLLHYLQINKGCLKLIYQTHGWQDQKNLQNKSREQAQIYSLIQDSIIEPYQEG